MLKQNFNVDGYWKVIVYWNVDYNFFDDVDFEMRKAGFKTAAIEETRKALQSNDAKAVTCSMTTQHISIVIFNTHKSKADYISSIVHEAEHIKQAILRAYNIEDRGEAPAYTIGYLVGKMYEAFKSFI